MNTKRPAVITLISVWFVISAVILVQLALSGFAQTTAEWYPVYLVVSALAYLASALGLWMMKKWSVILFIGLSVVNQIVLVMVDRWNIASLVIFVVLAVVCFYQYSKMK